MSLSWRIARRELRGGVRGFRVFLLCLMLGVAAIAAVGLVRGAIRDALTDQGAVLLGGDVEYQFTYRRATPEERAWITERATALSEVIDFRSMVGGVDDPGARTLTQVKAVDGAHPLLGALELDPPVGLSALEPGPDGVPGIFLAPALADRLGLDVGARVDLGGLPFVFRARLSREPDETGAGIGIGPPSMIALSAIEGTRLLAPGAIFDAEYRTTVAPGTDLDALEVEADAYFEGDGMRWRDRRRASPAADRFVNRLGSFLVLVGLAGLAVGGVGISATVSAWITRKAETIATLRAMGADSGTIRWVFLWQVIVLGALGIAAGLLLAIALIAGLSGMIEAALPVPVDIAIRPLPLIEAASYGALVAAIFALWPIARMSGQRVARLYRDGAGPWRRRGAGVFVLIAAMVAALIIVAGLFSGLWLLTLGTFAGILIALGILALAAWGVRRLARALSPRLRGRPALRAALAAIGGPRSEALPVILSLGLGLSVLAAVGQVDNGLRRAIAEDLPAQAPAFFTIDIQPDQLEPFLSVLDGIDGVERVETTPMLRGVVTEINGRPAREGRPDHWVLRGDRGVTYAATPRETLTAGTWWGEDYAGDPQISFAAEEAAELGLALGDTVTVNILGRDITAPITSLRDVDFATGGIGFVITFNPGALQGAPHTHLATIYAPPEAETAILRALGRDFPNITAIGVREAIDRVTEALGVIARATSLAAGVTLITGFVVLIGAAASGEAQRAWEAALLKTLGASRRTILWSFALRAALMGAAAGIVAVIFGGLAGYAVIEWVMDGTFRFAPWSALAIVTGGIVATLAAGLVFALRPLALRPAGVLRARD